MTGRGKVLAGLGDKEERRQEAGRWKEGWVETRADSPNRDRAKVKTITESISAKSLLSVAMRSCVIGPFEITARIHLRRGRGRESHVEKRQIPTLDLRQTVRQKQLEQGAQIGG